MSLSEDQVRAGQRHVIVALDVDDAEQAQACVRRLGERVTQYKIGSRLFAACGPQLLTSLSEQGKEIFLDLKYHDIPSVVAQAVRQVASRWPQVRMLTVHALGGAAMIQDAVAQAHQGPAPGPAILAVTALTSMTPEHLRWLGVSDPSPEALAMRLGQAALACGAHGLVCSAREVASLRAALGPGLYVTPGIRPEAGSWQGQQRDDQARVMTPALALRAGSDRLVIGRPILSAPDPVQAIEAIYHQLGSPPADEGGAQRAADQERS